MGFCVSDSLSWNNTGLSEIKINLDPTEIKVNRFLYFHSSDWWNCIKQKSQKNIIIRLEKSLLLYTSWIILGIKMWKVIKKKIWKTLFNLVLLLKFKSNETLRITIQPSKELLPCCVSLLIHILCTVRGNSLWNSRFSRENKKILTSMWQLHRRHNWWYFACSGPKRYFISTQRHFCIDLFAL